MRAYFRLSPATRLAIGLVSLTASLVLLADLFSGFLTHRLEDTQKLRLAASQVLAAQVALSEDPEDREPLHRKLIAALKREPELLSAAVVKNDGTVLASAGDHARRWTLSRGQTSTLENVRTDIFAEGGKWGEVELAFKPATPATLMGWVHDPLLQGFAWIFLLGFIAFWLYLRRMLRYLDPNSAVPEHVRTAFDTLTEGILVTDKEGNVMLANQAFCAFHKDERGQLLGVNAGSLSWLRSSLLSFGEELPWMKVITDNRQQVGIELTVDVPFHGGRKLIMNCAPIKDEGGWVRGSLTTFSDVTELHERTERLRITIDELAKSQEEIRIKNEELTRLATRDALTGCFNRRALMSEAESGIAEALRENFSLCCIMTDIDHFKSVNDRYGHGVGDQAIQAVANVLTRQLRKGDILGRYGGEEFCLILPKTTRRQALKLAESMRAEIEATAGAAIPEPAGIKLTCSFGVADLQAPVHAPMELINLADQALYQSKQSGRNRVTASLSQEVVRIEDKDRTHDELTDCLNRQTLMSEAERSLAEARRENLSLCCIMVGIDHFISINNRHGEDIGDQLIQAVANALKRQTRKGDILARYGADEFCIILPKTTRRKALLLAESMRAGIEAAAEAFREPAGIELTGSFGIAYLLPNIREPIELINVAGQALRQSKQKGGGCVTSSFDISQIAAIETDRH
jgi:diguanylate cyclase (GGDEF)-like protein